MSYKWVTAEGSAGKRSYKVSQGNGKHYVSDYSGNSLGSCSSMEDAISILKSDYGGKVWSVEIGDETTTSCFPGSTLILGPGGWRALSEIDAGDLVISHQCGKQLPAVRPVTRKLRHAATVLWNLSVNTQKPPVLCTPNHAFLTGRGWIRARYLREGDELAGRNVRGPYKAKVLSISESERVEPVYNLYTAGEHNFVAGGFVVHNFSYCRSLRTLGHRLFVDPFSTGHSPVEKGNPSCHSSYALL